VKTADGKHGKQMSRENIESGCPAGETRMNLRTKGKATEMYDCKQLGHKAHKTAGNLW